MPLVFYRTEQRRHVFHSFQRSEPLCCCTQQFYIHINKVFATLKIFFNLLFIFQKEKEEEVVKRHFYSQLLILSKF